MRPILCLLFAAGCATTGAPVKSTVGEPAVAVVAANPLGGDALSAAVPGTPEVEALQKDACDLWPLFDTYRLTADPVQICVTAIMYLLSTEAGPLAVESIELGVSNVPSPPTIFRVASAGMHKVGRCYGADRLRTSVWSFQFVGCTPNESLVTERTRTLALRRQSGLASTDGAELARWTFSAGAQPAVAAASPPAPAPAPGPAPVPPPASRGTTGGFESPPMVSADAPTPRPAPAAARPPPVAVPPERSRVLYEQGAQLLAAQRYGEALDRFSACLDLDPRLSQGYAARGNALLGLRRYPEAAADYSYALELSPQSALPLYGLAEAARGQNDVRKARSYYQRFLDSKAPDATGALKEVVARRLSALR